MLSGTAVLDELTQRGNRYSNLHYEEHQELKKAITPERLREFFNKQNYPITVDSESPAIYGIDYEHEHRCARVIAAVASQSHQRSLATTK